MSDLGKLLVFFGVVLLAVGLALTVGRAIPWLGRLPGDVHIKREHFTFYFPVVTSILVSIALTLLLWLWRR